MSPLVALLLFGFMFVIALSLTIWAALTLLDESRRLEGDSPAVAYVPLGGSRPVWRSEEHDARRVSGIERRSQASSERANGRRSTDPPEHRTGLSPLPQTVPATTPIARGDNRRADHRADTHPADTHRADTHRADNHRAGDRGAASGHSNDEFRGARATVTQRPNNDDAFERFLENDRD